MCYHYAEFLWSHDPGNREAGQHRKVALYREAAPLLDPPAQRFDLPLDCLTIPGYLRLPRGQAGRVPVIVFLGGLESTKEENYLFENRCLQRGLATFTFDGPGQGEMYFQAKLRLDFHQFTSAVVDWLEKRPEVDATRPARRARAQRRRLLRRAQRGPQTALQGLRGLGRAVRPVLLRADARAHPHRLRLRGGAHGPRGGGDASCG